MRHLRWIPAVAGIWMAGTLLWAVAQQSQLERRAGVVTAREAYVAAPRQLVASPLVVEGHWSPDGRYLLVTSALVRWRRDPFEQPEVTGWVLTLWNSAQQRATQVAKGAPTEAPASVVWLARSNIALLTVIRPVARRTPSAESEEPVEREQVVVRLDAARGAVRTVGVFPEDVGMTFSPYAPVAVLEGAQQLWILRSDGSLSPPLNWGSEAIRRYRASQRRWTPDGRMLCWQELEQEQWMGLDLVTGTVGPVSEPPVRLERPELPQPPVSIRLVPQELRHEEIKESVKALWLEGERSKALICGDVDSAQLSPRGDAVFDVSQGAGFVAPLVRESREQYEEMRQAERRRVIMSNARQIGLAILMYVQDYDETFPPNSVDVQALLMPYLRNEMVFSFPGTNFVYLLNTNSMASIDRPAETMVGFIQAPGGRAVIWVDGHVTWESQ